MELRIVKSFKTFSIVALASMISLSSFASVSPFDDAHIQLKSIESGKKAIVTVWNLPETQSASLRVLNAEGKLVYKESFTSAAYAKKFDFSQLPAGQYKVLLWAGTHTQSESFEVMHNGSINIMEDKFADKGFKPYLKVREGNKVDLQIENRFAKKMNITIKNQKGQVAYQKQIDPQGKYAHRLNLSQLPKDNYMLSVKGEGFEYAQEISIF
ncbi:hypothetical protein OKW21_004029 [Catalinimonas alkaloidigena]|uniref:hypothetical protein n=1 Tax=Catalinimonas alkaloidigena TaxID=1075417 RepID=UPI002406C08E|nr:hypothetical protein [Catalinimonas alkaloidigena]MDF9798766.1 hypothetical protein [Catalinimonas alkaloidigena]